MTSITDRCRIGQANLEYKSAANDTWKLLLYTTFNSKYNVFGIDVKFGSIKITQKFGAGTGTCIAMLTAAHYKNPKLDMDVEQEMALVDFLLEFDLVGAPACEFSKDLKKKNNDSHSLSDFPLYHCLPEMRAVRLRLPQPFFKPRPDQDKIRTLLMRLLSGDESQSSTPLPSHLQPSASFSLASRPSLQSSTTQPPSPSHISRASPFVSTSPNAVKAPETIEDKKRKRDQLVGDRDAEIAESRRKVAKYDEEIASLDAELQ